MELVAKITDHLNKIQQYDQFNTVIEINPDAILIAEEVAHSEALGPLHGVPILIKDNISTADKMKTSAGSRALADNVATKDAAIVKRLRNSGAIIVGKTNLTEFSNFMSEAMPNGYSSRGGQTISQYGKDVDPSGSSSGSAVAVALGLVPMAIGTETCGSIVSPARVAGILGLKPTRGRIPGAGIVPISSTLDTAGPMAKKVDDLQALFAILSNSNKVYSESLETLTIGVLKPEVIDDQWDEAKLYARNLPFYEEKIVALARLGVTIKYMEPPKMEPLKIYDIMINEFEEAMNDYLTHYSSSKQRNLADIIAYNEANADAALKYGQDLLQKCLAAPHKKAYEAALAQIERTRQMLERFFESEQLDAYISLDFDLVTPAFTGHPSINIPLRNASSMPAAGMLVVAPWSEDERLIQIAKVLEVE